MSLELIRGSRHDACRLIAERRSPEASPPAAARVVRTFEWELSAAWALSALMAPVLATAQEANMSTTVALLGSGTATSRIDIDAVKPRPASNHGLACLPSSDRRRQRAPCKVPRAGAAGPRPRCGLGRAPARRPVASGGLPLRPAGRFGAGISHPRTDVHDHGLRAVEPVLRADGNVPATGTPAPGAPALAAAALSFTPSTPLLRQVQRADSRRLARCANERRNRGPGERRRQRRPDDGPRRGRGRRHGLGPAGVRPARRPVAPCRHRDERTARRGRAADPDEHGVRVVTQS